MQYADATEARLSKNTGPAGAGFGRCRECALAVVVAMALIATSVAKAAAHNVDFIDI
jgi:hypothetical protein